MAAGQGFKTFATGDVLTAADTNGYLMQGIWVFANATARDAAVTSPQEGNACYLKDTDAVQTYSGSAWVSVGGGLTSPLTTKGDVWGYSTTNARVAVGTNGQVLTADSTAATGVAWASAAAGSGWTSIASGSLSGSSLDLTSISASYKNLRLIVRNMQTSNSCEMQVRLNNITTGTYNGRNDYNANAVAGTAVNVTAANFYATYLNLDASTSATLQFDLFDYTNTTSNKQITAQMQYLSSSNVQSTYLFGACRTTSAIDRITVFPSAGTFSAGTYILYGGN